jgi:hypothetical protein
MRSRPAARGTVASGLLTLLGTILLGVPADAGTRTVGPTESLAHAADLVGSDPAVILIPRVLRVEEDLELGTNIDLRFLPHGRLVLASGVTLTMGGRLLAPASQWILDLEEEEAALVAPAVDTVHPHWFGAKGDGVANDTRALRLTAAFVNRRGGGRIVFVPGTYVVGRQQLAGAYGRGYAWKPEAILKLEGNTGAVVVEGGGSTLQAAAGLRFGSFDPVSGEPIAPSLPFTDHDYAAHATWGMVELLGNASVDVCNLELDGNIDGLALGGPWGDTGRQLAAYGVRALGNAAVRLANVHAHHHGLDGVLIGDEGARAGDPATPHRLECVRSEYNARQGLSWVGGIGLHATGCSFSHTGRARFVSAPGAGVDIEAEDAVVRDGLFEDCQLVDNVGAGFVADSGDGGYATFRRCLFWGTTNYSLWPNKPGLRFEGCTIHGTVVRAYGSSVSGEATVFTGCRFEDLEYPGRGVYRSPAGLIEVDADGLLIEDSTIVAHGSRGVWLDGTQSRETLRNVTITHAYDALPDGDFQSLLRGVRFESVSFLEDFASPGSRLWYLAYENEDCVGLYVEGPHVRWNQGTGQVCGP